MAADWFSTFGPHGKPALIGAAFGLATGFLLKRLVKSLVLVAAFGVVVYLVVASTTDWLQGVDIASAGRDALDYAKAHQATAWDSAKRFVTIHVDSSIGFLAGLLGGLALSGRRLWPRPSTTQKP